MIAQAATEIPAEATAAWLAEQVWHAGGRLHLHSYRVSSVQWGWQRVTKDSDKCGTTQCWRPEVRQRKEVIG